MNTTPCNPEVLSKLPSAIWCPGGPLPAIYRGSPLEMVRQMAEEMGTGIKTFDAVRTLCNALAEHRKVYIGLPGNVSEDILAGLFVFALLDLRISRPMPSA